MELASSVFGNASVPNIVSNAAERVLLKYFRNVEAGMPSIGGEDEASVVSSDYSL